MKRFIFAVPVIAALAACGTTDTYSKRAESVREAENKAVERSVDRAPKWMSKMPESKDAVYATGTAVSPQWAMSDEKARLMAFSHICMSAGGTVDKNSKMFFSDTENTSTEVSETAIRSRCANVDITGAEIVEKVHAAENGRIRTYVLVALPTGEANSLQVRKDKIRAAESARKRAESAFKELEAELDKR
jgi:hypothetical protein